MPGKYTKIYKKFCEQTLTEETEMYTEG